MHLQRNGPPPYIKNDTSPALSVKTDPSPTSLKNDTYGMWQYNVIVSFPFCLHGNIKSFKRTICFVCLFNCLVAEQRRNNCLQTKRSCGLHIRLGATYKSVALGRIRCFCLSQAARCTAGTRDNEFFTSREWATSRRLSAVCYERRAW